jgi:hypothetical protein
MAHIMRQGFRGCLLGSRIPVAGMTLIADGRILTRPQEHSSKLVDQLWYLEDNIRLTGTLAGIKVKRKSGRQKKYIPFLDYLKEDSVAKRWKVVANGLGRSIVTLQYS